jgi:predicted nucleotidyltransferase
MKQNTLVNPEQDPALTRFRAEVGEAYGDRLERVVLFGSRARGDHRRDSDYDITVFTKSPRDLWDGLGTLSEITTSILLRHWSGNLGKAVFCRRLSETNRLHA